MSFDSIALASDVLHSLAPHYVDLQDVYGRDHSIPSRRRYTIVHISDPHLSRLFYREHLKSFKILLRELIATGFDHLVISGDMVSTGDEEDFYVSRQILERLSLLSGRTLTVVPGNHDIFGGPHRATDVLSFPQHIRGIDYRRHLQMFTAMYGESFEGAYRLDEASPFPFIKRTGPFLLIGLNSVMPWSVLNNPLGTNGMLDERQLQGLESLRGSDLLEKLIPVAVVHHHFNDVGNEKNGIESTLWERIESSTMRMKKRRKTLRLLQSLNVRYILHGHIHRNEIYAREGITLANGAGSVCDDPQRFLKYNKLSFDGEKAELTTVVLPIEFQTSVASMRYHRSTYPPVTIPRFKPHPAVA